MRNRQQTTDNRQRTVTHFAVIALTLFLSLLNESVFAQAKETPIITFRQKLLREKHEDNGDVENIDSLPNYI